MVQYSSQFSILEGGPKNPLKGTSMKFLVSARGAQPWVDVGSKGVKGDPQWHVGVNPFAAEALPTEISCMISRGEVRPAWQAEERSGCSVACLEWSSGEGNQLEVIPSANGFLLHT